MAQLSPPTLVGKIVSPTGGTAEKQLYFAAFVLAVTVLIAFSRPDLVASGEYLAGLAVLALATALAVALRQEERTAGWAALVPVLDIVAVGLVRDVMRRRRSRSRCWW